MYQAESPPFSDTIIANMPLDNIQLLPVCRLFGSRTSLNDRKFAPTSLMLKKENDEISLVVGDESRAT